MKATDCQRANEVIAWVMVSCGGKDTRATFRGFCRDRNVSPPSIRPVDKSRYINLETAAIIIYQFFDIILMWHVWRYNALSDRDRTLFGLLCNPEIQLMIKVRAAGCSYLLKPLMHHYAGFHWSKQVAMNLVELRDHLKITQSRAAFQVYPMFDALPPRSPQVEERLTRFFSNWNTFDNRFGELEKKMMAMGQRPVDTFRSSMEALFFSTVERSNFSPSLLSSTPSYLQSDALRTLTEQHMKLYLEAAIHMIEKHDHNFVRDALEAPHSIPCRMINRSGEKAIGKGKNILQTNQRRSKIEN